MSTDSTNIEKFSGRMDKEDSGCTISINETIQAIPDVAVAGLYSYLLSKPQNWIICVQEIRNHYNLSKDKVYRLIGALIKLRLLEKIPIRENGRFAHFRYKLYLKPFPEKQELVGNTVNKGLQPFPEKQETEKQETENQDTYKTKIYTKQRIKENKDNINIHTQDIRSNNAREKTEEKNVCVTNKINSDSFEEFWEIYPSKKAYRRAKCAWDTQGCDKIAEIILTKLREQILYDRHFQSGYIPNPDKYIFEERWKDQISYQVSKTKGPDMFSCLDMKAPEIRIVNPLLENNGGES